MNDIRWGIIGAGNIANETAEALAGKGMHFKAVFNRTYERAVEFAGRHNVEKVCSSLEELLSEEIDAVYIATLHNYHYGFILKALQAGKHVLCEKAITLNSRELNELNEVANENNLILAEAMTIYHMPLYEKLSEIIASGSCGRVFMINVSFGSWREYDESSRFFDLAKAGGAMLDIGVYALSLVRYFLKQQPSQIASLTKPAFTGADEQFGIIMKNDFDEMAAVSLSMHVKMPKRAVITCEKGYFEIMEYPRGDKAIYIDGKTREVTEITAGNSKDALWYEFRDMEKAIKTNDPAVMKTNLTADVMDMMTRIRHEWDYRFPEE